MTTAAHQLLGVTLEGGWTVVEKLELEPGDSGGAFSVGYRAEHSSGDIAYVKALDYSAAFDDENVPAALNRLTAQYEAERALLELCAERKLRRVIRALAHGTIKVPGYAPPSVSYLIFEMADGDARSALTLIDKADQLVALELAHHACVALAQLHSCGASHQDIKPSNLLVWLASSDQRLDGKIGDLGNAHLPGRPSPYDEREIPGDLSYAPPEQLYGACRHLNDRDRRIAADFYMLGNLLTFLLVRVSYNAVLYKTLDDTQHWLRYGGTFSDVLPALVDAHGLALTRIREGLHEGVASELATMLDELCHPDPEQRGDRKARARMANPWRLERFISRLTRLQHQLRIELAADRVA